MSALARSLSRDTLAHAVEIAARAEQIRGYESIKAERARRVRAAVDRELDRYCSASPAP